MGEDLPRRRKAVIVDVDGTLVNVDSIRYLVTGKQRDFDAFHTQSIDCPPRAGVTSRVRGLAESGIAVVLVSGRLEKFRRLTEVWLALNNVPADELWMRSEGDFRPDHEIKAEMFGSICQRFDVVGAIDDRPELLAMWRELGIQQVWDAEDLDQ